MHYNCILLIENYISNFFLILSIFYFTRAKIMHLKTKIYQILTEMIFSQKFSPKHSSEHLYKEEMIQTENFSSEKCLSEVLSFFFSNHCAFILNYLL